MTNLIFLLLALLGAFYTFAPHTIHVSSGLDFGYSHTVHVLSGTLMLLMALYLHKQMNQPPFDDLTTLATV